MPREDGPTINHVSLEPSQPICPERSLFSDKGGREGGEERRRKGEEQSTGVRLERVWTNNLILSVQEIGLSISVPSLRASMNSFPRFDSRFAPSFVEEVDLLYFFSPLVWDKMTVVATVIDGLSRCRLINIG